MKLFQLFTGRRSAPLARERLQILLTHERGTTGQSGLIAMLREDILAVIAKHVEVAPKGSRSGWNAATRSRSWRSMSRSRTWWPAPPWRGSAAPGGLKAHPDVGRTWRRSAIVSRDGSSRLVC